MSAASRLYSSSIVVPVRSERWASAVSSGCDQIGPGTTELTRMPSGPSSPASVRATLNNAAFEAA